jgi:hypothetical protein
MRARFQKVSCRGPDGLNLVDRLRNWRPFVGELQSSKEFRGKWLQSVAEIFEDFGLKPTSSGTYILNASTAVQWIGLIATILGVLNHIFEEQEQSMSMVLDSDRVQAVTVFMRALYAIFCNEELQDLFGLESLKMIKPTRVIRTRRGAHEYADDVEEDSGELVFVSTLTPGQSSIRATWKLLADQTARRRRPTDSSWRLYTCGTA